MKDYIKMLIYGEPGVGKSVLASQACKLGSTLYMSVENRVTSIKDNVTKISIEDIDKPNTEGKCNLVVVNSWTQAQKVYNFLLTNPGVYDNWVIDSLSEMNQYSIFGDANFSNKISFLKENLKRPQFDDWNAALNQMNLFIRAIRDLDMNIILTAHARHDVKEGKGIEKTGPFLQPAKAPSQVCGQLDYVGYMTIKAGGIRKIVWQPTTVIIAKDCSSKLGKEMEEPTLEKIFNAVITA